VRVRRKCIAHGAPAHNIILLYSGGGSNGNDLVIAANYNDCLRFTQVTSGLHMLLLLSCCWAGALYLKCCPVNPAQMGSLLFGCYVHFAVCSKQRCVTEPGALFLARRVGCRTKRVRILAAAHRLANGRRRVSPPRLGQAPRAGRGARAPI